MRISYQLIIDSWQKNKRVLLFIQIVAFLVAGLYLFITPKIYEAYFEVHTAKIMVNDQWSVIRLARNTRRDLMSPQGYPSAILHACMQADTNSARRQLVNSVQINIINDFGGVMGVAVRISGIENAKKCANLIADYIVSRSNEDLQKRLSEKVGAVDNTKLIQNYQTATITLPVKMSDSFVQPRFQKVFLLAFLISLFGWIGFIMIKKRYAKD